MEGWRDVDQAPERKGKSLTPKTASLPTGEKKVLIVMGISLGKTDTKQGENSMPSLERPRTATPEYSIHIERFLLGS